MKKLGYFPNLNSAIMAWAKPTKIFVSAKRLYDFKVIESYFEKTVSIFRIPSGQQLDMKHEGQRSWNNETIYTDNSLDLKVDDIIIFECSKSQKFRILNKTDWSQYGFNEYYITSDYL